MTSSVQAEPANNLPIPTFDGTLNLPTDQLTIGNLPQAIADQNQAASADTQDALNRKMETIKAVDLSGPAGLDQALSIQEVAENLKAANDAAAAAAAEAATKAAEAEAAAATAAINQKLGDIMAIDLSGPAGLNQALSIQDAADNLKAAAATAKAEAMEAKAKAEAAQAAITAQVSDLGKGLVVPALDKDLSVEPLQTKLKADKDAATAVAAVARQVEGLKGVDVSFVAALQPIAPDAVASLRNEVAKAQKSTTTKEKVSALEFKPGEAPVPVSAEPLKKAIAKNREGAVATRVGGITLTAPLKETDAPPLKLDKEAIDDAVEARRRGLKLAEDRRINRLQNQMKDIRFTPITQPISTPSTKGIEDEVLKFKVVQKVNAVPEVKVEVQPIPKDTLEGVKNQVSVAKIQAETRERLAVKLPSSSASPKSASEAWPPPSPTPPSSQVPVARGRPRSGAPRKPVNQLREQLQQESDEFRSQIEALEPEVKALTKPSGSSQAWSTVQQQNVERTDESPKLPPQPKAAQPGWVQNVTPPINKQQNKQSDAMTVESLDDELDIEKVAKMNPYSQLTPREKSEASPTIPEISPEIKKKLDILQSRINPEYDLESGLEKKEKGNIVSQKLNADVPSWETIRSMSLKGNKATGDPGILKTYSKISSDPKKVREFITNAKLAFDRSNKYTDDVKKYCWMPEMWNYIYDARAKTANENETVTALKKSPDCREGDFRRNIRQDGKRK